ncbi:hypothetical protein RB195_016253 [Necator americanus]|uniref:HORMA domain-containing protein n=1 Tax=Necator americanus TaxID=51031 RepID=A0ABR1E8A0_NECAM
MPPPETMLRKSPYKRSIDRKSWVATFPEEISNLSESTIFITRCMYIVFCHILASRRLLPTKVFKKRTIDGDVRAYVMDTNELLGARLMQKFKGVTDAVKQSYLHELILVVSTSEENDKDAIETYMWRMRYIADGDPEAELIHPDGRIMAALRFRGMERLKKELIELLLMIRTLCRETLGPLPAGASSALRITYNQRAPKGYQAPGFYRSPEDPVLRTDAQEIEIAKMQTKHHGALLTVQSVFIDDAYAVGLRLKEIMKLDGLDDSLNESFEEENGAGDDVHRSFGNDTMEKISGAPVEQVDVVEVREGERSGSENGDRNQSPALNSSMIGTRGSSTDATDSGSIAAAAAEVRPRRGRRGKPAVVKVSEDQPIIERAGSPVIVSASPTMSETPNRGLQDDSSCTPPPAKRTPGAIKTGKITPKAAPPRKKK